MTLSWSYNPWRANWRRPAGALALELAVAALAGVSFSYPHVWPEALAWGGLGLLLLLGMTTTIFLPVTYRLDERGVTVRFIGTESFRAWSHYRNFYDHATGAHLTTMPRPSALDPFRGHYLLYSGNRQEVVAVLRARIKAEPQTEQSSDLN